MAGEAKKVLLVDDEPTVLNLFQEYCTLGGISCETACSGYRALEDFENDWEKFGAIVADTSPGVIELARRARQKLPLLPIIFVTGYQREDISGIIREFQAGLLLKPVPYKVFISAISIALRALDISLG